jgi:hypothetical protein
LLWVDPHPRDRCSAPLRNLALTVVIPTLASNHLSFLKISAAAFSSGYSFSAVLFRWGQSSLPHQQLLLVGSQQQARDIVFIKGNRSVK